MYKPIPYEKLTKKQKKALDAARRGSWGDISPVTRRPENPKAYNRKKARRWKDVPPPGLCLYRVSPSRCAGHARRSS